MKKSILAIVLMAVIISISNSIFAQAPTIELRAKLNNTQSADTDAVVIYFATGATVGWNSGYDSPKLMNQDVNYCNIYAVIPGYDLFFYGLPPLTTNRKVLLGFNLATTTSGSYNCTITASEIANFAVGTNIYLVDSTSSTSVVKTNLTTKQSYPFTFTSTETDNNTRFYLIFEVVPPINATFTPESSTTFCQGNSVKLDANTDSNYTYQWQQNDLNLYNATSSTYTAKSTGSYTVIVTQGLESATSVGVVVTVNPLPTAKISGTATICRGDSSNLTIGLTGTKPWTITYSNGSGSTQVTGINTSQEIIRVSPSDTTTYTVTAVSDSNCTGISMTGLAVISVNPISTASVSIGASANPVCSGTEVTFTVIPVNGGTAPTYQWYVNGLGQGLGLNTLNYTPLNGDTVTCVLTSNKTCTASKPATSNIITMEVNNCTNSTILSGYVKYENKDSTGMPNTKVYLTNAGDTIINDTTTDKTGHYEFLNVINGTYKLSCSTTEAWGGVNPIDALLVNRTYIGLYKLTDALKRLAADVNNDKKINPTDALMINRRYIGLIKTYKINDWLFSNPTVTIDGIEITQEIKAICAGDAKGAYVPPARVMSYELGVRSNISINIDLNKPFDIPVYLNDNAELGALGIKLLITNDKLQIIGIKSDLEGLIYNVTDDGVNVAWATEENGFMVNPSQPLFYITAMSKEPGAKNEVSLNNSIQISSESVLVDIDANMISIEKLAIPQCIVHSAECLVNLFCYPNPFNRITNLNYTIPEDGNVEIGLYNVLGEKAGALVGASTSSASEIQKAGDHSIKFDGSGLSQGVYYCVLRMENGNMRISKTNILIIAR